jgi:hypothetical protein
MRIKRPGREPSAVPHVLRSSTTYLSSLPSLFNVQRRCWSPENSSQHSSPPSSPVSRDPRSSSRNVMLRSPLNSASKRYLGPEILVTGITRYGTNAAPLNLPPSTKISYLSIPTVLSVPFIREFGFLSSFASLFRFGRGSLTPLRCGCAVVMSDVEIPETLPPTKPMGQLTTLAPSTSVTRRPHTNASERFEPL